MTIDNIHLSPVSFTMLMTLAARAVASERVSDADFHDPWAVSLLKNLPGDHTRVQHDHSFVRSVVLRAKLIDQLALDFFWRHPEGIGVGLGCGLCARSRRIQQDKRVHGGVDWYNIDLPAVIDIRNQLLSPLPRETVITCSITDISWLEMIKNSPTRPLLLVMEGVVSYLSSDENAALFQSLGNHLKKRGIHWEIIFDAIHPALVDSEYVSNKAGGISTPFRSGFSDANAVKSLHPSIDIVAEHTCFSRISPRHAVFAQEFEAASLGQKPYNVFHLKLGKHE